MGVNSMALPTSNSIYQISFLLAHSSSGMWPHHPFPRTWTTILIPRSPSMWFFRTGLKGKSEGFPLLFVVLGATTTCISWAFFFFFNLRYHVRDRRGKIEHSQLFHSICSPTQDSVFHLWFSSPRINGLTLLPCHLLLFIAALLSPFGWFLQLVLQTRRLLTPTLPPQSVLHLPPPCSPKHNRV